MSITDDLVVNTTILSKVLGISPQMIGRLVRQGMPKVGRGRYDLPVCVQYYLARRDGPGASDLNEQRQMLYAAQTEKTEIENQVRRGELIEMNEAARGFNEMAVTFVSQLDPLGARLAPELVGATNAAEIKERIDDETRHIRASVADILKTWADSTDSIDDNSAAA